jgi:hypothetical protein
MNWQRLTARREISRPLVIDLEIWMRQQRANKIADLLPWNWKASQQPEAAAAA